MASALGAAMQVGGLPARPVRQCDARKVTQTVKNWSARHMRHMRRPATQHVMRALAGEGGSVGPSRAAAAAELKAALLAAVSKANSVSQGSADAVRLQAAVEELAGQLAALNPTPDPATSPLISGSWALVYTGRSTQLAPAAFGTSGTPADSLKRGAQQALQAASDAAYQFFYRYFPLIAGSAVGKWSGSSKAANIQVIDLEGGTVDNIARFKLGSTPGEICVSGEASAVLSGQTGGRAVRLRVTFSNFTVQVGDGLRVALPLQWLSPVGFVETLYLDEQLRVSVGDKGSLFVVMRQAAGGGIKVT